MKGLNPLADALDEHVKNTKKIFANIKEEFDLSKKECNILTQKTDMDKQVTIAICPNCISIKSKYFVGKECLKCSVHNNEGDPLSGWKKSVCFIPITVPEEKLVFEKGFFTEDVKEFIRLLKKNVAEVENAVWMHELDIFYKEIDKLAGEKLCP